ncbi:alpha/beta fold hydrolase [Okibacterium endophyticum]
MNGHRHADQTTTPGKRRWGRWVALGLVVAGSVALGVAAATAVVARMVVTPPRKRQQDVDVLSVDLDRSTITLTATPDTELPGRYGLWCGPDERYVRLGEVLWKDRTTVTRKLTEPADLHGARLRGRATFSGWFYQHPSELNLLYEDVSVHTPVGPAPAWLVPPENRAAGESWVIIVHGRGTTRQEGLRAVPTFSAAGLTSLLISYRNDGHAPPSADGLYGLGDTEWADVDAAIDFAVSRGARSVYLMGWSMGGAVVMQTALRGQSKIKIDGVILESPVLDWARVLEYQADIEGIPRPIRMAALSALSNRWGRALTGLAEPVNLIGLDIVSRADELTVPVLVLHSDDDGFVPSSGSHDLAAARPDLVTFVRFTVARHTKLWNYAEARWSASLSGWLRTIGASEG